MADLPDYNTLGNSSSYVRARFYDHVGQRIAAHRTAAGLTRKQLATKCKCAETAITNAEYGHNCPFHLAVSISDALDVNLYELIPESP